jgi:hypothetical protein
VSGYGAGLARSHASPPARTATLAIADAQPVEAAGLGVRLYAPMPARADVRAGCSLHVVGELALRFMAGSLSRAVLASELHWFGAAPLGHAPLSSATAA